MTRVAVKGEVLRWAIGRSGLTMDDLQRRFPRAREWEAGESQPTLRQLEGVARLTLTPLGFFFLPDPPAERMPVPYFRTVGGETGARPSPGLLETIHSMEQRQAWMRQYLVDQGQEPLPFVKSERPADPCASVAERIRHALMLRDGWAANQRTWTLALRTLREAAQAAGILVVVNSVVGNNTHRRLDPSEFRGFVLVDEYAPLVFVNGADGKAAQMLTFAHELAHVVFGSSAAFDLREMQPADDPTEQACNRVAAEFLIPERELRKLWLSVAGDPEPFQAVARQFKVSAIVAARRALDLGLVHRRAFFDFYRAYEEHARQVLAGAEGGNFYATQDLRVGRRFAAAVIRAAGQGKLLYTDAYRLTGLYGRSFDRYAAHLELKVPR